MVNWCMWLGPALVLVLLTGSKCIAVLLCGVGCLAVGSGGLEAGVSHDEMGSARLRWGLAGLSCSVEYRVSRKHGCWRWRPAVLFVDRCWRQAMGPEFRW